METPENYKRLEIAAKIASLVARLSFYATDKDIEKVRVLYKRLKETSDANNLIIEDFAHCLGCVLDDRLYENPNN